MRPDWDIFCKVIDNYGDIGVTWRLARQLVGEHRQRVRLWVDDLRALAQLCPVARMTSACQHLAGVEVRHWEAGAGDVEPADGVIEAFACSLPVQYRKRLSAAPGSLWLNLEYLSAEAWVEDCHRLPSPQAGGKQKFFFFPGFTGATGGLLRESMLLSDCNAFQQSRAMQNGFLEKFGLTVEPDCRLISLFAYENPAIGSWLEALGSASRPTHLLVPEGRVLAGVSGWCGRGLSAGDNLEHHGLRVSVLPFMSQSDYDRLLWACDFNVVRGEDSFVRAQWAGRPLLWHIYPQEEGAHWPKLDAFLSRYSGALPERPASALRDFWNAWNRSEELGAPWRALEAHEATLRRHALDWRTTLAGFDDLATQLMHFKASV